MHGTAPMTGSRVSLLFFLISGLAGILGCSTSNEGSQVHTSRITSSSSTNDLTQYRTRLVRNGKFTDAAMLAGLDDSSSWDMNDDDRLAMAEEPLRTQGQQQPESKDKDEPSDRLLNTHLTRIRTDHIQETSLDGKWHARLGWSLMVNGNHTGAAAAYREALRQNDTLAEAYLGFGILLNMQGNPNAAVEAYQKALTLNPQYAAALVHLGYAYADGHLGHHDLEKAKRLFSRASQQGDPFAMIALIDLKTRN